MRMRRKTLLKLIALLMTASCLMTSVAFAAVPETVQPLASAYFGSYCPTVSALGGGKVQVTISVTGTSIMDEIGADSIVLYESTDQTDWEQVKTWDKSTYPGLFDEDTSEHTATVSYYGVAGRYYKAYICIYAKKGTGMESSYIWTYVKRAT